MPLRRCVLLLCVLPAAVTAQDAAPPPPPWSGEASVGVVATSGNSENQSANARLEVVYAEDDYRNTFNATALQASSTQLNELTGLEESTATSERYTVGDKADFLFSEHNYAFLQVEYEKDLIGPIRERLSETLGYGRKVLDGPDHTLDLEIGAGFRQTESQITPAAPVALTEDDAIARGRVAYRWNFREGSHFGETFKAESGESNTFLESVTEAKLDLIGAVFALASYTVRRNTDVPAGTHKTDTVTAFSLGWSFGKN